MSAGAPPIGHGPGGMAEGMAAPIVHRPALRAAGQERPGVRVAAFAALAGYGMLRWATLLRPAPGWRLFGLLAVAVALTGAVPYLGRRTRAGAGVLTVALLLVAFPVAGLPWEWFRHLRLAVSADWVGTGLQRLPDVLVPYVGHSQPVRLVIALGAAVLLLDAAAVLAFAPRAFGDGRRAAAALPLLALAVVPSTLIRPQLPYLQGIILFVLLAAFLWGERVRHRAALPAFLVVAAAALAGAFAASHIDPRSPWVNYRAWAGSVVRVRVDAFQWNQTYGPLRWPQSGHVVMTVRARIPDYWKAEDLDNFDGYGWVAGGQTIQPELPAPSRSAIATWTQTIHVTIRGMETDDVIAAGTAAPPSLPGGVGENNDPGTWVAGRTLRPGTHYAVTAYSPQPSPAQLSTAGGRYPATLLANDLTLAVPTSGANTAVTFPVFGTRGPPTLSGIYGSGGNPIAAGGVVIQSPYAPAYALARRLAAAAPTPYAYVVAVQRYLAHGYTYDSSPPVRRYPLESFLFRDRVGYCQQFSGAMAMLLRMGGVPARVASGFTTGTYANATHDWVVTDTDAHAWVEAWFPTYGWVRFDPTPAGTPGETGPAAPAIIKGSAHGNQALGDAPKRTAPTSGSAARAAGQRGHGGGAGGPGAGVVAIAALGVSLLAGLVGLEAARARRGGHDLVAELERAMVRTRRPLAAGTTLSGLEGRLAGAPEAAAYVRTLREARYGGVATAPTSGQRRALRRELARGLGPVGRLRALWALPPRLRS